MVNTIVVVVVLTSLAVGGASASNDSWQIKPGLTDNVYPYGSDCSTRFGVDPHGTWDYDGRDAVHPPVGDPAHDLAFIYSQDYYKVYRDMIPHDAGPFHWGAPVGWPPPWKPWIPPGDHPRYPTPGLLKDTREPGYRGAVLEFWLAKAYAPLGVNNPDIDNGTCAFAWYLNREPGFEIPDFITLQLWGNSDLEAVGVVGDLILSEKGMAAGEYKIPGIPQWGLLKDGETPSRHDWVIQATYLPEPPAAQLVALACGAVGLGVARFRRTRSMRRSSAS